VRTPGGWLAPVVSIRRRRDLRTRAEFIAVEAPATQAVAEEPVDGEVNEPASARKAELGPAMKAPFAAKGWGDQRDTLGAHRRAESAAPVAPPWSNETVASLAENPVQAYGDPGTGKRKSSGDAGGR
jgi:hypothetical protein